MRGIENTPPVIYGYLVYLRFMRDKDTRIFLCGNIKNFNYNLFVLILMREKEGERD